MGVLNRRERGAAGNNLSFLDVISAGFGAIVLLLVITKTAEPTRVVEEGLSLDARRQALAEALPAVDARLDRLRARLGDQDSALQALRQRLLQTQAQAAAAAEQAREAQLDDSVASTISDRLFTARESLTEEMQRLQQQAELEPQSTVAGIPVDSEYIIFVIDTSGSMLRQWGNVVRKLEETLDIYPNVRGMQVMNDMGQLMFDQYEGQWMPDTPSRRRIVVSRLVRWQPFSNSSPVEGITRAIRTFYDPEKTISIYVFGDEFTGVSIQRVLDAVERINPRGDDGRRRVRIHAIGFPTQFVAGRGIGVSGMRFSLLMRELTLRHDGTFVGLRSRG
ncbi:MAG: hypothetical protein RQ741_11240 [Wenzhouxiangellaceae bacterium]|nr:hypothetical protein [Wenzhouxiangellaceae bacterium]